MKTHHYLLSFVMAFFFMHHTFAKVIRVDNNTGAAADYVKLQDGINNAESGDTIYVVGSPNIYDRNSSGRAVEIRLNKSVTIIGPGYFLGENENTQVKNQTAKIYQMNIGEGANNASLTGLDLDINSNSYLNINAERFDGSKGSNGPDNVKIYRNFIEILYVVDADNTLVAQNYFASRGHSIALYVNSSRTLISNNIISTSYYNSIYGRNNVELVNTVINNNVLNKRIHSINGATIQNNIFIDGGFYDSDNNNVKNNLFTTTKEAVFEERSTGNTESNNIYSAVQANIFGKPSPTQDSHFQLATDSPAIGKGINGEDLGAYGGPTPYKLSGLPSIPAIYDLNTSGVGTQTKGLKVEIKVKSHN